MSMTVTATTTDATPGLCVRVLTGAATVQNGVTVSSNSGTGVVDGSYYSFSHAITPGTTGSLIFGAMALQTSDTYESAVSGTTFTGFATTQPGGLPGGFFFVSSAASTGGTPQTLGLVLNTGYAYTVAMAMAEILASGTLAVDTSSPALVTGSGTGMATTTAAFSPPAGAILLAMTAAYNPFTMALTDSAGSFTWTQLASASLSGVYYADLWAGVPATAPSGPARSSIAGPVPRSSASGYGQYGNDFAGSDVNSGVGEPDFLGGEIGVPGGAR